MQRQTHHIVIVTAYAFHSDIPYPFLDAVGPGLVEWDIAFHIESDFIIGERGELNFGHFRKCDQPSEVASVTPVTTLCQRPESSRSIAHAPALP